MHKKGTSFHLYRDFLLVLISVAVGKCFIGSAQGKELEMRRRVSLATITLVLLFAILGTTFITHVVMYHTVDVLPQSTAGVGMGTVSIETYEEVVNQLQKNRHRVQVLESKLMKAQGASESESSGGIAGEGGSNVELSSQYQSLMKGLSDRSKRIRELEERLAEYESSEGEGSYQDVANVDVHGLMNRLETADCYTNLSSMIEENFRKWSENTGAPVNVSEFQGFVSGVDAMLVEHQRLCQCPLPNTFYIQRVNPDQEQLPPLTKLMSETFGFHEVARPHPYYYKPSMKHGKLQPPLRRVKFLWLYDDTGHIQLSESCTNGLQMINQVDGHSTFSNKGNLSRLMSRILKKFKETGAYSCLGYTHAMKSFRSSTRTTRKLDARVDVNEIRRPNPPDFAVGVPVTYSFDDFRDRIRFYSDVACASSEELRFIRKPVDQWKGQGVEIVENVGEFLEFWMKTDGLEEFCTDNKVKRNALLQARKAEETLLSRPEMVVPEDVDASFIVQKYIADPLTILDGKKFDIRTYFLVASTQPLLVYYHTGFIRMASEPYEKNSTDRNKILTNISVGNKDHNGTAAGKLYMDFPRVVLQFGADRKQLAQQSGEFTDLEMRRYMTDFAEASIKRLATATIIEAREELGSMKGRFGIFGIDMLIDSTLQLHLLEYTYYPALWSHVRFATTKSMLSDMLRIAFSVNEAQLRAGDAQVIPNMFADVAAGSFELLIDESKSPAYYFDGCSSAPKEQQH